MAKKYIDAEKLRKDIEKERKNIDGLFIEGDSSFYDGQDDAYNHTLALIDSLQQEQPEVDLEKDIADYWTATGWCQIMTLGKFKVIARYFYGLGRLNAKKEE